MAHNRLTKWMLQLLLLPPVLCMAQQNYTTTYERGMMDLTPYAATKSLWVLLPGGGVCNAGSENIGSNLKSACIGGDSYIYILDPATGTYTKQTAMGTVVGLAYKDDSSIWALRTNSTCTPYGLYGVYKRSGSSWTQPNTGACTSQLAIGADGALIGVSHGIPANGDQIWRSVDGGASWSSLGTGWKYAATHDQATTCAVNNAGHLYLLDPTSNAFVSFPTQPPGTTAGCVHVPGNGGSETTAQSNILLATWTTTGAVKVFNGSTGAWSTVMGLTVGSIVAATKNWTIGLDTAGHPYHLNFRTKYLQATTSGTWSRGCPDPAHPCQNIQPAPTHTATLKVSFPHSVFTNTQSQQTLPWGSEFNVVSIDANPMCDFYFGPTSAECNPAVTGDVICNASHADLSDPGQLPPYTEGTSHDYESYLYTADKFGPIALIGAPPAYGGAVTVATMEACITGIPTCPHSEIFGAYFDTSAKVVQWQLDNVQRNSPWLAETPWIQPQGQQIECMYDDDTTIPMSGEVTSGVCD